MVDLTLDVSHLIDTHSLTWNVSRVCQLIAEPDVQIVLKTRIHRNREDNLIWGFTKDGQYSSKSGYKFLSVAKQLIQNRPALAPIEKVLWRNLWKTKTSPKLRHFLWRALSGALAVKDRLQSRGIHIDSTCSGCGNGQETVCHALFHCNTAANVWEQVPILCPPNGFSQSSVFLNLHHLIKCSQNIGIENNTRLSFPWILWNIWKARNILCFEGAQSDPVSIWNRSYEETSIWLSLNGFVEKVLPCIPERPTVLEVWRKPPANVLKCNIGTSWVNNHLNSGVSWVLRNHQGLCLAHSRRSYSRVLSSLENDILGLWWAIDSVSFLRHDAVIFESSSRELREAFLDRDRFPEVSSMVEAVLQRLEHFRIWSIDYTSLSRNQPASLIARSVTEGKRYQSYTAKNGPFWLQRELDRDAGVLERTHSGAP